MERKMELRLGEPHFKTLQFKDVNHSMLRPCYCVHRKCHETLFQGCTFLPSINISAAELWPQQVAGLGLAGRQAEVKGWRWSKTPAPVVTLRDILMQLRLLRAITRQQSIKTPCLPTGLPPTETSYCSDVTGQLCSLHSAVYICGEFTKVASRCPYALTIAHSDVYPTVLLAAVSEWANPSPWCFKWNLLSVTGPVFRTNWASSLSGHVWLYRQGGLGGERLHNTAGCSLQHKWFIGQWELEWKTKIREGGRIIESEEVKGRRAWIGRGNEKSKSEGRVAEGGHGFSQSLLEPAFLWMMNSWKSLKRERKEEENEGGYRERDGKKKTSW